MADDEAGRGDRQGTWAARVEAEEGRRRRRLSALGEEDSARQRMLEQALDAWRPDPGRPFLMFSLRGREEQEPAAELEGLWPQLRDALRSLRVRLFREPEMRKQLGDEILGRLRQAGDQELEHLARHTRARTKSLDEDVGQKALGPPRGTLAWRLLQRGLTLIAAEGGRRGLRLGLPPGRKPDPARTAQLALTLALKPLFHDHALTALRIAVAVEAKGTKSIAAAALNRPGDFGRLRSDAEGFKVAAAITAYAAALEAE